MAHKGPSQSVRENALALATGANDELGWLDVLKLGLQYAKSPDPRDPKKLPDHKDMNIAIDCAKELEKIAMPRLSAKAVEDDPNKNRTMVSRGLDAYLPEGTDG